MKAKTVLFDIGVTLALLALCSALIIVVANSYVLKGICSAVFNFSEDGNIFSIDTWNAGLYTGYKGIVGILISLIAIALPCVVAFFGAKTKHYGIGMAFTGLFVLILIPLILPFKFFYIIGSFILIMFINPYYTLLVSLPFSPSVNVYVGFFIIALLVSLSAVGGYFYEKYRLKTE